MRMRSRAATALVLLCLSVLLPVIGGEFAPLRPWPEYRAIMWVGDSPYKDPAKVPTFFTRLREMGINTAMVYGDGNLEPLLQARFPYYVENIINRGLCLKFHSKVQDWDKFVTDWTRQDRPEAALVRDYCLDDPEWQRWARNEMQQVVRKNAPHQPLLYDIRDELSTTISANPFDYDFHPLALAGFREWLKKEYPDLAALNAQWETAFSAWDDVKPFTTDQVKNRMASGLASPKGKPDWGELQRLRFSPVEARKNLTRWNFSPWADFRTYMDISLARVLGELRQAAREIDPQTPVGIEGTQMPHAFGGYDLWRLSQALDWVEPYDIANAREIFGSFMPGKPLLTTVFENDTEHASRRLWHLLLEGDRGCIIWWSEDCFDWRTKDLELTAKAKALAPVLREMTSPLARLFMLAEPVRDPILIHYSQPSIQADWLIESTVDGSTWLRRFSSFEADHNKLAKMRNGWLKAFQDLGFSPRFVSAEQIESGELRKGAVALVLPSSWALSDREVEEMRRFLAQESRAPVLLADGMPGVFDQRCKLRKNSPLLPESLHQESAGMRAFALRPGGAATEMKTDVATYLSERIKGGGELAGWIQKQLLESKPEVTAAFGDSTAAAPPNVRIRRFAIPAGRLVAFERNVNYQMSEELKQAGGNEPLEKPVEVSAKLAQPAHVYDLRSGTYFGLVDRFGFRLDPWRPSLFAFTPKKLEASASSEGLVKELSAK